MGISSGYQRATDALDRYRDHTYALLRIVTGYLFLWHGSQKLLDFPSAFPFGELSPLFFVGGVIELVGGALVCAGLFTRVAAFVCSGQMAVAYWMFHAPQANPIFPILNDGDLPILYAFVFLYIACRGGGIWSFDGVRPRGVETSDDSGQPER